MSGRSKKERRAERKRKELSRKIKKISQKIHKWKERLWLGAEGEGEERRRAKKKKPVGEATASQAEDPGAVLYGGQQVGKEQSMGPGTLLVYCKFRELPFGVGAGLAGAAGASAEATGGQWSVATAGGERWCLFFLQSTEHTVQYMHACTLARIRTHTRTCHRDCRKSSSASG